MLFETVNSTETQDFIPLQCVYDKTSTPPVVKYNIGSFNIPCSDTSRCIQPGTTPFPPGILVPCQLLCTSTTCNNLGECNTQWGIEGETLCHCDSGPHGKKHLNDSDFCLSCEKHWYPSSIREDHGCTDFCIPDIATLNGTFPAICDSGDMQCRQCSGNGECSPEGTCLCNDGYTGEECNIQCIAENGLECSGHGKCVVDDLQDLLQFELQFENNSGALYSCECDPQDPYTEEERANFKLDVANNITTGELDPPPIKNYYGEFCEHNCKSPPWKSSEICNGFGECEVNKIADPNGAYITCTTDSDCKNNENLLSLLSGVSDWSSEKGPFCHKEDHPPGCTTSNFTNTDCYYILALQRPPAARSKECMRTEECRTYMDVSDWKNWCDNIEDAKTPIAGCPSGSDEICEAVSDGIALGNNCNFFVSQVSRTDMKIGTQIDYCYEKDKARYPFAMTEEYRFINGMQKHDDVAEEFAAIRIKHPGISMEATNFCSQYLKKFNVDVTHIRSDTFYLCEGKVQHTSDCITEALSLISIRQPFYVRCGNGEETKFETLDEAISFRRQGCVVVEEVVDVTNATLENLLSVKSGLGGVCVDNNDCSSNSCFEKYMLLCGTRHNKLSIM